MFGVSYRVVGDMVCVLCSTNPKLITSLCIPILASFPDQQLRSLHGAPPSVPGEGAGDDDHDQDEEEGEEEQATDDEEMQVGFRSVSVLNV